MHALITGGAGFIGSHLAELLLSKGQEVTVIDDLSTGSLDNIAHLTNNPNFHFAIETITNETVMDRLISDCDLLYHLAAAVGVKLVVHQPVHVIETNILGSETVVRVANRYRKRVVLASTSEIYGKSEKTPFKEDDDRLLGPTTRSRWSYSCSKAVDEFLALAYHKEKGLPTVIVRFFNVVGPRQTGRYGMVVPRFVHQALADKTITVYGDGLQSRCFCHVKDAVRSVAALAECAEANGQVFNLGSDEEITILDLAKKVVEMTESKSKIKLIPYDEAYEEGFEDMRRRVPDISKIRKVVAHKPEFSFEATLQSVIDYFKARHT
ncbi:MAG: NAD-dependent epimerase/dehydratase family protein [Planctomycetes bacterium]|nr:NAD-dependent epimerase/dehydratase family protein [Planctomycetota bacterium]